MEVIANNHQVRVSLANKKLLEALRTRITKEIILLEVMHITTILMVNYHQVSLPMMKIIVVVRVDKIKTIIRVHIDRQIDKEDNLVALTNHNN